MIHVQFRAELKDRYRSFQSDVRFTSQAAMIALFGNSGAGKTLCLQAMAGLLPLQSGRIEVDGRCLYDSVQGIDLPVHERAIGYVFQDYALFPHLTVEQNIAFGLRRAGSRLPLGSERQVSALLEQFGLSALARSRTQHLSGGQRQRVALARALACQPKILLLDEPFAALNTQLREQMRGELKALHARTGIPILLVTHDVGDVLALAEQAICIEDGKVIRQIDVAAGQSMPLDFHASEEIPSENMERAAWRKRVSGLLSNR